MHEHYWRPIPGVERGIVEDMKTNEATDHTNKADQQSESNPLMAVYNPLPPQFEQPAALLAGVVARGGAGRRVRRGRPGRIRELITMNGAVSIYDTTLRDGAQGEGVSFSVEDKLSIAERLDEVGVHFIEGGWPGSNAKDVEFFQRIRSAPLKHARLAAFGSTRRAGMSCEADAQVALLLAAETPVVTIVGKSWDLHVHHVLETTLAENLCMIRETVAYLKAAGRQVFYDAEHFFDGYQANRDYALACVAAAQAAGADAVVLCETNGGAMPWEVEEIVRETAEYLSQAPGAAEIGIHTHDDAGVGVANALAAVRAGATQVQGTLNGIGERVGNCNLCTLIPNLQLKLGLRCLGDEQLARLTELSRFASSREPCAQSEAALRRRKCVRAQGRHPRGRGYEGRTQLPAHRPRAWSVTSVACW